MKNQTKALVNLCKSIHGVTTSVTFIGCSLLMTAGVAFAESEKNLPQSLHPAIFPLLADARTVERRYDPRHSPGKADRRGVSISREKSRDHKFSKAYRTESRHQEQRQPRFQRNRPPSQATPKPKDRDHRDHRKTKEYKTESRHHTRAYPRHPRINPPLVVYPRHHYPRERVVVRPFRYVYPYHRHHLHDDHIWGLLAFTAITLAILDNLNEQQQREYELALYNATSTPIGETIFWREGDASGAVTTTREGTSNTGRYCREYLSEVNIGGNQESVYGTACQQADGSWKIEQ